MIPSELASVLSNLEGTPSTLRAAHANLPEEGAALRGTSGPFSFIEQIWHLADLECEGFGLRISRLLSETEPQLADFDGGRIASERHYQEKNLLEGLKRFETSRVQNLARLSEATAADWHRFGTQEGVGRVALFDLPRMMLEHDRSHIQELIQLFDEVLPATKALAHLRTALIL